MGLIPLGIAGMAVAILDMIFGTNYIRSIIDVFVLGASSGLLLIPLKSYIQYHSDNEVKGQVIATSNFVSFFWMFVANIIIWGFSGQIGVEWLPELGPRDLLAVCFLVTVVFGLASIMLMPEILLRFFVVTLTRTIYRMDVEGVENIPEEGPVLLLPNHVTWVDGLLITAASNRPVRFMIGDTYYNKPILKQIFTWLNYIPVPEGGGSKAVAKCLAAGRKALDNGDVVCIFPEGRLTRSGVMSEFKSGFTRMLPKEKKTTIIPMYLGMIWGSIFSLKYGEKLRLRKPSKVPYPMTVTFGEALEEGADAAEARKAVTEIEADIEMKTTKEIKPLHAGFLRYAKRNPFKKPFQDSTGEPISNASLLIRSLALRNFLESTAPEGEQYIGLILPTSTVGISGSLAVMYADKVPVFLNYTASKDALEHAVKKCNMKRLVTSKLFLRKIKVTLPESLEIIYLEDIAKNMPSKFKKRAIMQYLAPAFMTEKKLFPKTARNPEAVATVLFSSGSTGTPKGVVLTHRNFSSNLLGMLKVCGMTNKDTVLGTLPLFHCFGFLSAFWLPILNHNKIVYHPNPLEAAKIGEIIQEHEVAVMFGTPTFLNAYARKCKPEQMKSLRVVLSGAEKLRKNVADSFYKTAGVYPIEAYGATELSPGVSINIPKFTWDIGKKQGKEGSVGHPIPGVQVKVVDVDNGSELPHGEEGLLMVAGPNVMQGYLDEPEKTAEVLQDGWYNTGDVAVVDRDGYITLTGRLSRFSKIGGEMVPHGAIEENIHDIIGTTETVAVVAGRPDKVKGEKVVVFHTEFEMEVDELIAKMKERELPNLWIPRKNDFILIEEIPLLGSGKVDLKKVEALGN